MLFRVAALVVATLSRHAAAPGVRSSRTPERPWLARSLVSQGGAFRIGEAANDDELPKAREAGRPQPY
ncbi:hypothetical protein [Methylobacterium brachiatum]